MRCAEAWVSGVANWTQQPSGGYVPGACCLRERRHRKWRAQGAPQTVPCSARCSLAGDRTRCVDMSKVFFSLGGRPALRLGAAESLACTWPAARGPRTSDAAVVYDAAVDAKRLRCVSFSFGFERDVRRSRYMRGPRQCAGLCWGVRTSFTEAGIGAPVLERDAVFRLEQWRKRTSAALFPFSFFFFFFSFFFSFFPLPHIRTSPAFFFSVNRLSLAASPPTWMFESSFSGLASRFSPVDPAIASAADAPIPSSPTSAVAPSTDSTARTA